jgi:ribosome-binding protein aMBF1 (putative translation factor)
MTVRTLTLPTPISRTASTVTLSRADYESLAETLENVMDRARLIAAEKRETEFGKAAARKDAWPVALLERRLAGESPVRLWREQRGLSVRALARASGVKASYLSEIENRKKPGSVAALGKLAAALGIAVDDLIAL